MLQRNHDAWKLTGISRFTVWDKTHLYRVEAVHDKFQVIKSNAVAGSVRPRTFTRLISGLSFVLIEHFLHASPNLVVHRIACILFDGQGVIVIKFVVFFSATLFVLKNHCTCTTTTTTTVLRPLRGFRPIQDNPASPSLTYLKCSC